MSRFSANAWAVALVLLAAPASGRAAEPPTPESLARALLEGEALYTVRGGLKPLSDGFWQARFPATADTSPEVDAARRALAELRLGPDLVAGVHVFAAPFDGKKTASAFVAHRPALKRLIERRADAFEPIGVTATDHPADVLAKIDRAPRAARWRAFGLAFGYPEHAVEFFVAAGEKQAETKQFVPRDFVQVPTFGSATGRFVYAVPKGHAPRTEDTDLRARADDALARFRAWHEVYIERHRLGWVALLENWAHPQTHEPAPRAACRFSRTRWR